MSHRNKKVVKYCHSKKYISYILILDFIPSAQTFLSSNILRLNSVFVDLSIVLPRELMNASKESSLSLPLVTGHSVKESDIVTVNGSDMRTVLTRSLM